MPCIGIFERDFSMRMRVGWLVHMPRVRSSLFVALLAVLLPRIAAGQGPENVAVVINDNSAASQRIGEYYARQRGIPAENVVHIRTTEDETITRDLYTLTVERPLAVALTRGHLQDRILYLVLTKGVPIRINGTSGLNGTVGSVDSELTLLYRRMLALSPPAAGRLDNPYFLAANDIREAKRFSHRDYDIFLVSRLDAYTVDEDLALVDRAKSAQAVG